MAGETHDRTAQKIDGARKAAILMVLLGEDASSRILQHFDEPEIVAIGREVARLGEIDPELASEILREYRERILVSREAREGGPEAARRMLERSLPPERATVVEQELHVAPPAPAGGSSSASGPAGQGGGEVAFRALESVRDADLAQTLEIEHRQTAARVLL